MLYSDYGLSLISSSLKSNFCTSQNIKEFLPSDNSKSSQLSFPRNLDRHYPLLARQLPPRMGGAVIHDTGAK